MKFDESFTKSVQPVLQQLSAALIVVTLAISILSLKWRKLTNKILYLQFTAQAVYAFIPSDKYDRTSPF